MNNLQLKALRQSLFITTAELASMFGTTPRTLQYWEAGTYSIPPHVIDFLNTLSEQCESLIEIMEQDIEKTEPGTEISLPFYGSYDQFKSDTHCSSIAHWRMYQSVMAQLFRRKKVKHIDDSASIPAKFLSRKALKMFNNVQPTIVTKKQ